MDSTNPSRNMITATLRQLQVFEWSSEDGKEKYKFYVTLMLDAMKEGKLPFYEVCSLLDKEWAATWLPHRDLNQRLVASMDHKRLNEPLLGVEMPRDRSVLIIDGSHRYAARLKRGKEDFTIHIVEYPYWKEYASDLSR